MDLLLKDLDDTLEVVKVMVNNGYSCDISMISDNCYKLTIRKTEESSIKERTRLCE